MKKKILGTAIIAVAMATFTSTAQAPRSESCPAQGCPASCTCTDNGQTPCRDGQNKSCGKPDPFAGLTLSDTQREQLRQLKARRDTARVSSNKADRMRNDSLRMANNRAERQQYLAEVKAIIGPDQYVTYLENLVLNSPQRHPGKALNNASRRSKISHASKKAVNMQRQGHQRVAGIERASGTEN